MKYKITTIVILLFIILYEYLALFHPDFSYLINYDSFKIKALFRLVVAIVIVIILAILLIKDNKE